MQAAFIGIDWGTTHRRAVLLGRDGAPLEQQHDDEGLLASSGRFAASLQALLAGWPTAHASVPVVMAGMVGSASGWQDAGYLDAGTPLAELGSRLAPLRDASAGRDCFIVPGVRWQDASGRVDVMRGEETQLLGALAMLGAQADGWYVLPGTHSKWVRLQAGCVTTLRTYMSGELFALLGERGTLAPLIRGGGWDDAVFERGVAELGDEALSHALFGARAKAVTGALAAGGARAYVSGLLIGAEWRDLQRLPSIDAPVRVIGEPALARVHALCARRAGVALQTLDAHEVQLAAWRKLMQTMENS